MSLALSTLIYEWRRYMAAIVALAFAGLLVLAFVGLFMGIGKAFTATIDRSPAQIMILGPKAEALFNGGAGVPRRIMPQIYMHPEVLEVSNLDGNGALWMNHPEKGQKVKREFVQTMVVDPDVGAVTLPVDFDEQTRLALAEPYAVAMDVTSLGRLGVKLGDKASLNGQTVKVKAVIRGYPNMMQPMVILSRQTAKIIGLTDEGPRVGPLMVKIRNPARAEEVRDQLNAVSGGLYRAWTREELGRANEQSLLKESFIVIILGFALIIGSLVGIVITWQTLRGAIFANIKEFASLRALGVSMGSLRRVVMELSFWVGIAGLGLCAALTWGVAILAGLGGLPMSFPTWSVITVAVLLIVVAILSGMLSLGVLKQSQPADLLR
ncbi:MAG: ABC transporter permease [Caulobacteraceae bacterium]|nr:ABC transporter permease [Caulobacteraceae bacterium]